MYSPSSRFDRPDQRQARLIDAALLVQRTFGTRAAAILLADAGIGFRLTVRVLSEPYQRRGWAMRAFALVPARH
jgi:hypothetical protein